MKHTVELNQRDIQKVLAAAYDVDVSKVNVSYDEIPISYGTSERYKVRIYATIVTSEDDA